MVTGIVGHWRTEWISGRCPVEPGTYVHIILRNGEELVDQGQTFSWHRTSWLERLFAPTYTLGMEIIAYRPAQ